jgi:lysyl-tRNA synthetase class 2
MDYSHNPDFTMLEFYWAYANYEDLMQLTERMFGFLVPQAELEYKNHKINLIGPWRRIGLEDLIQEYCHFEVAKASDEQLRKEAKNYGLKLNKNLPRFKLIDEIYKKVCRPNLIQPTFVTHHPLEMCPLAKQSKENPQKAERFQLVIGGLELVNAYSELNDPEEQEKRFKEQETYLRSGEKEAHRYDKDFVEALNYGMPPAAGWGMGIDRLMLLLSNTHAVREVILFPTMRPK